MKTHITSIIVPILCLLFSYPFHISAEHIQNTGKTAQTTGDCSHAINAGDNAKIAISCGVSKEVLDEVLKQSKINRKALEFALTQLAFEAHSCRKSR